MHVVGQDELEMIVDVHVVAFDLTQSVAMLELNLIRFGDDVSRCHWQVVHQPEWD